MGEAAAIGLRAHSGWAALVAIAGPSRSPSVVERRIIQLADPTMAGSKQPYHAAEPLKLEDAEKLVARCLERTYRLAQDALGRTVDALQKKGHPVNACGLVLASGRALPSLAGILASHAMIHAAEGELFRQALAQAGEQCGLLVLGVKERELFSRAERDLDFLTAAIEQQLRKLGRSIGPPWRQDEKYAALVGWLALANASRKSKSMSRHA
ncbi:MAG: hypothetical protein DMG69_24175 [Acidobacteria bacterium]|nr:MAG: hypothetical protein DMG69_24175 [Acidobacteriota bacterium]